jgi:Acyl-CoA thioesterase C-terminal domain/Acyl-CoA thioesterase N-terminal domain
MPAVTADRSFFRRSGELFESTELTRGPWSAEHQHGGPPSALLVGRVARAFPDRVVTRAVVEFLKPIPIARLSVAVQPPSGGRRVQRASASLVDEAGTPIANASVLLAQPGAVDPAPPGPSGDAPPPLPPTDPKAKSEFPFFRWQVGYHTSMELRFARGHFGAGPVTVWMRQRVPLVDDETPTPLERLLTAADSVHGVSWNVDPREMSAINPDLVVSLHRFPAGEWLCLDAQTANEASGIGVAASRLWDEKGPLGWSLQTLLLTRLQ